MRYTTPEEYAAAQAASIKYYGDRCPMLLMSENDGDTVVTDDGRPLYCDGHGLRVDHVDDVTVCVRIGTRTFVHVTWRAITEAGFAVVVDRAK